MSRFRVRRYDTHVIAIADRSITPGIVRTAMTAMSYCTKDQAMLALARLLLRRWTVLHVHALLQQRRAIRQSAPGGQHGQHPPRSAVRGPALRPKTSRPSRLRAASGRVCCNGRSHGTVYRRTSAARSPRSRGGMMPRSPAHLHTVLAWHVAHGCPSPGAVVPLHTNAPRSHGISVTDAHEHRAIRGQCGSVAATQISDSKLNSAGDGVRLHGLTTCTSYAKM
jgi:hypothetical protein